MNWNTWDSERIYNRYVSNQKDVLFDIGNIKNKRNGETYYLYVYAPAKYVKRWMTGDQAPAKRYIQSAVSKFIKSHPQYSIPSDFQLTIQRRYIDNMIVSNDLEYYLNDPNSIVLDFNGVMNHQMELDL